MVVVYGTVCLDRLRKVPRIPNIGGYAEITEELALLGGEAANTALLLRTWGVDVRLVGNPIGPDIEGEILARALADAGLDAAPEATIATPVCDVYITPDGERTMFGRGFASMSDGPEPASLPGGDGDWFTADPNHGDLARKMAAKAANQGLRQYLMDFVQPEEPIQPGGVWQSSTDWAGERGSAEKNLAWVGKWADRHGCATILTDGPRSLFVGVPGQTPQTVRAFRCSEVIDATGAGDAFRAATLCGLVQGRPFGEAVAMGSAAGCLNGRALGATSARPPMTDVRAMLKSQPEIVDEYLRLPDLRL